MICLICDAALVDGLKNLCATCRGEISAHPSLCSEQVLSNALAPTGAYLIDMWGGAHDLEDATEVGRQPKSRGISILDGSVSRRHASLFREGDRWFVRDHGSTNGVLVAGERIDETAEIRAPSLIAFGTVGFYFVDNAHVSVSSGLTTSSTVRPEDDRVTTPPPTHAPDEDTFPGLPEMSVEIIQPSSGGGGYVQIGEERLQLTLVQLEFLEMLVHRMVEDSEQPPLVRGFVPTPQLVAGLSWDTGIPSEEHLKQLVRRVRRALVDAGIGNLIESRRGFGYRLRVRPTS